MADDNQRRSLAERVGRQLFGDRGAYRLRMLREVDPGFARLFEDWCYGGLYARGVLDDRVREQGNNRCGFCSGNLYLEPDDSGVLPYAIADAVAQRKVS
jgi:hypothetical protein